MMAMMMMIDSPILDDGVDEDGVDDDDRFPETEPLVEAPETWRELATTPCSQASRNGIALEFRR